MIPVSALVFLLATGFAQAPAKQPERPASEAVKTAPELARLDLVLSLAQEARQEGRLSAERYAEFLKRFRVELGGARAATPPSPAATALVARILARLGESQQAEAVLGPALEANPDDAGLRVALGHARFEAGDYAAALAQAEAVLKLDPADKQAAALKRFSLGRSRGTTSGDALLPAAGLEEASFQSDPRIVSAARGALARKSAIGYADEAMRRLKIEDPQAALRYLAMGEAVDPGYADIPMQQGFAHRQLREHAAAVERFARAETLWRAQGTPRADEAADMARKLGEEQAKASVDAAAPAEDAPKPQERKLPLWPVGAALIAVGLGVAVIIEKRRSEEQARRLIEVAGPAGIALIGAAVIAASLFPPTGLAVNAGGAAALTETAALGRAAAGAYLAKEVAAARISYAKSNSIDEPAARVGAPLPPHEPAKRPDIELTPKETRLLREFFGRSIEGADSRARSFEVPAGLSRGTLEKYREIIRWQMERGMDKNGAQAARLKLVERALGETR